MDSTGVPHKINRHVYKAVNHLGKDYSNFANIYHYVKDCTRNLKPVPHLKETIQKSLNNLRATGIVKMDARQKYKLQAKYPSLIENNKLGETSSASVENLPSPKYRKRKRRQIVSDDEGDEEYTDQSMNRPSLRTNSMFEKDSRHKYILKPKFPNLKDNQNNKNGATNSNEILSPQSRNLQQIESEEDEGDGVETVLKRFKASTKNISRTRVPSKKLPKHRQHDLKNKSSSKIRQPAVRSSSKANIIYKNIRNVPSDVNVNNEPNHNDKDLIINDLEEKKSKEATYDFTTREEEKTQNDSVEEIRSINSKKTPSHQSGDFEDAINDEPDEILPDIKKSSDSNTECQDVDGTLESIRRYSYNYLN